MQSLKDRTAAIAGRFGDLLCRCRQFLSSDSFIEGLALALGFIIGLFLGSFILQACTTWTCFIALIAAAAVIWLGSELVTYARKNGLLEIPTIASEPQTVGA